jgi:uncharacterized membrane protein
MNISPLQLFYAQEARMYSQLLLLTGFSSWALIHALSRNNNRCWGLFILGATLASYTAYFSFPVFLAMGLYVLLIDRRRERIFRFGLSMLVVAGLYLPWLGIFFSQTRSVQTPIGLKLPTYSHS